jgi:hypothetical protein
MALNYHEKRQCHCCFLWLLRLSGWRERALFFHGLGHGYVPRIEQNDGELRWRVHLGAEVLKAEVGLSHLWLVGEVSDAMPNLTLQTGIQHSPLAMIWKLEWAPLAQAAKISGCGGELKLSLLNGQ